jgi:hypothetical protein
MNAAPIAALSYGSQLTTQVTNPNAGKLPEVLGAKTISFAQTLVPFPQYTGLSWTRDPIGDSYYNAATVLLQHRGSRGLFLQAAYTFGKDIGDVPERYAGRGSTFVDPNNLRGSRGLSDYDRPHSANVSYIYQLPIGPGHRFVGSGLESKLLGNWQVAGITMYGSGNPVIITAPSNTFLPGITALAQRLHDPRLPKGQQNPQQWFDTTAFGQAPSFSVGNDNRVEPDLRGPAYGQWNLGVARRQAFKDDVNLELRFDVVNVWNNRALGLPNGALTSGTFGQITSSGQARSGKVVVRLTF